MHQLRIQTRHHLLYMSWIPTVLICAASSRKKSVHRRPSSLLINGHLYVTFSLVFHKQRVFFARIKRAINEKHIQGFQGSIITRKTSKFLETLEIDFSPLCFNAHLVFPA